MKILLGAEPINQPNTSCTGHAIVWTYTTPSLPDKTAPTTDAVSNVTPRRGTYM